MAVQLVTNVTHRQCLSTDDKPTVDIPIGSTLHFWDTGAQFVWDGSNWQDDLRMIFALEQAGI